VIGRFREGLLSYHTHYMANHTNVLAVGLFKWKFMEFTH